MKNLMRAPTAREPSMNRAPTERAIDDESRDSAGSAVSSSLSPRSLYGLVWGVVIFVVLFVVGETFVSLTRQVDERFRLIVVLGAVLFLMILALRFVGAKRSLEDRFSYAVLPSESFNPSTSDIDSFILRLFSSRRSDVKGFVERWGSALRVTLESTPDGRMSYVLSGPKRAERTVKTLQGVELVEREQAAPERLGRYTARAELVLSRNARLPLADVEVGPNAADPKGPFARVMSHLNPAQHECSAIAFDLLPMHPGEFQRGRRFLETLVPAKPHEKSTRPVREAEYASTLKAVVNKVTDPQPLFAVQILVEVRSDSLRHARRHLKDLLAGFEQFHGHNRFRARGLHLGVFLGTDQLPGLREFFDFRMDTSLFLASKRSALTVKEARWMLTPITADVEGAVVVRSKRAGVPRAPQSLREYPEADRMDKRPKDLLPLGRVALPRGECLVGVPLADLYFLYFAGQSRWGKTEAALAMASALARAGHGVMFIDPHTDGLQRLKPYLADVADRVIELRLSHRDPDAKFPGWNLFDMEGRRPEEKEARTSAVVNSFASALHWTDQAQRSRTVLTMASDSLVEIAEKLCKAGLPELQPTIFQLTTILSDDDWLGKVLPFLSVDLQNFWRQRFSKMTKSDPAAIVPTTNLVDRLRRSEPIRAVFGQSHSTYNVRKAMDQGAIVLACPAGIGEKDVLVTCFFVYDLLQSSLSRVDTPFARRRPFFAFIDELQTIDGAGSDHLAKLLEQSAKYGLRALMFNQSPEALKKRTFDAIFTNSSHLATTKLPSVGADAIAKEWRERSKDSPDKVPSSVIQNLDPLTYLIRPTIDREVEPTPFFVRTVPVTELWWNAWDEEGDLRPEDALAVAALDEQITENMRGKTVADVTRHVDALDDEIPKALETTAPRTQAETTGRHDKSRITGVIET